MHLVGLSAVRVVRKPSLIINMSAYALILQRSAFDVIHSLEIFQQASIDQTNRLYFFKFIDAMHLVGLRAVRFVRSLSLFTIIIKLVLSLYNGMYLD